MFAYCNNSPVNNVDECGRETVSVNLLCIDEEQVFYTGAYIIEVSVTLECDAVVSNNQNGAFVRQSSNGIEYGLEDDYLSLSIEDGLFFPTLSIGTNYKMQQLSLSYNFFTDSFSAKYSYENKKGSVYSIDISIYSNRSFYKETVEYACEFDRRLSRAVKLAGYNSHVSAEAFALAAYCCVGGAAGLLLQRAEKQ